LDAGTAGAPGRVVITGSTHVDFNGTVPTIAQSGAGTGSITANSTDSAGQIAADANAGATALVVTFANTYTVAPICVISAVDAGAANTFGAIGGAGPKVTSTATTMTVTFTSVTAVTTYNYHCFKTT